MPDPSLTRSLDLVRLAQGGDDAALDRLFERYYDRVRRVVRLRLGRRLRSAVESGDILQETFAAAVRAFDSFEMRDEGSFIQWLSKLAERQIIAAADYHGARKRDRRREVALDGAPAGEDDAPGYQHASEVVPPDDAAADREEQARVEACLLELPEPYRELVILRNYVGAEWDTVARETGRPTSDAARMMHARAMVELGKLLDARRE